SERPVCRTRRHRLGAAARPIEEMAPMINGMATLLGFQLVGELAAWLGQLPVSGPLLGMGALLVWLHARGEISGDLTKVCDVILANMALLFVPVGVGAMRYSGLFASNWYVIALAILAGAC